MTAKPKRVKWRSIKLWLGTYERLKRIAAETGETMAQTAERLARDEEELLVLKRRRASGEDLTLDE